MGRKKIEKIGIDSKLFPPKTTIPTREDKMWETIFDAFQYTGDDFDEFIQYLKAKKTLTNWAIVNANKLQFFAINDKWYKHFTNSGYEKEVIDDVLKHTGLGLKIGKYAFPIGEAAMPSLWRLAMALRDIVPRNVVAMFFNGSIANKMTQKGESCEYLPMVYGGKIDTFLTSVYTPCASSDIMLAAKEGVEITYGENECVYTYFDHSRAKMILVLLGEETKNMSEMFKQQLIARYDRMGIKKSEKDFDVSFGLVVTSGETGNETVSVRSHISLKNSARAACGISVGEDIVLYHKGQKEIASELKKRIGNVYISFQDVINKLIIASDIKILDWRSTIVGLAEYAKIPEDVWKQMIVNFEIQYRNQNIVTGYDIFNAFLDSVDIYRQQNVGATENMLRLFETKIHKILNENIIDYDNDEIAVKQKLATQYVTYANNVLVSACEELKIPVAVRKRLVENLGVRASLYAISNSGEEMPTTALDIYELISNSGIYMREWFVDKKGLAGDELESRMAKYQKSLTKAKDVCYVAFDKETA
jgi:hypothetical protein